ncbi:MAG: DUF2785 domain-containing protein [Chloroflexi bacterium]|nr:DUF2785 domain-containing protein [Chloroflexota bacterium]
MLAEAELKKRLQQSAANDFAPPETAELFPLALEMSRYIGAVDAELRDELIYPCFATWILDGLFEPEQMRQLLNLAIDDDHLFFQIGEQGTDSVFTRSFSMLLLPLLLIVHRKRPYLSSSNIQFLKQTLFRYLEQERDKRGYVPGKGWAHAVAHAADALDDLAQCKELDGDGLRGILDVIRVQMSVSEFVYTHAEDERMSVATVAVMKRPSCPPSLIADWLQTFPPLVAPFEAMPDDYYRYLNVKQFLRSLYFRAAREGVADDVCQTIRDSVEEINKF